MWTVDKLRNAGSYCQIINLLVSFKKRSIEL